MIYFLDTGVGHKYIGDVYVMIIYYFGMLDVTNYIYVVVIMYSIWI